jgi:hypothetical protein
MGDIVVVPLIIRRQASTPIQNIYFPGSGVASIVTTMRDGATVEVSTVGNDRFVGVPLLLGVW